MPRGGKREGSGRKAGVPNKATAEIKSLAQEYGPDVIAKLAGLAGLIPDVAASESDVTQLGAMRELLDRGYGKASQAITGADGGAFAAIIEVITGVPRRGSTD